MRQPSCSLRGTDRGCAVAVVSPAKMKMLCLVVLALVASTAARAEFVTAGDLARYCAQLNENGGRQGLCTAYVTGVADLFENVRNQTGKPPCIPQSATVGGLVDASLAYMQRHPEWRQSSASWLVMLAVGERYCPER
jgi:hypothetical protein